MNFRLLGPFTIEQGGRSVELRGNRSRAVLALLLLNAGALVPTDQIVDAVWGRRPPRTVRTQVQAQISEIRGRLRSMESMTIQTHTRGYLLRVDPTELDVAVFADLVRRGRALAARGDRAAAAELLRTAVALYTGPPLGDVSAPFARSEAVRLADDRLTAVAELIGLDLELGRHRDLIPQLTGLVERHPLREALWRHLVVALHRADRRGDAIACFLRAREVLREELGVDPGRELAAVYRTLLVDEEPPPTPAEGDGPLLRALSRLEEAERLLHDIRHQLEATRPARGRSEPATLQ